MSRNLYEQTQRIEALDALVEAAASLGETQLMVRLMRQTKPAPKEATEHAFALKMAKSHLLKKKAKLAKARVRVKTFFAAPTLRYDRAPLKRKR